MEWTRTETIALSMEGCKRCHGLGLRDLTRGREVPCQCVFRSIFRACYARFRECNESERSISRATVEPTRFRHGRFAYGRKDEEYIVDFLNVTRRALSEQYYRIFKYHYLLGADWRLCCQRLGLDRGTFFHMVYRMEAQLGRVYRELEPYALYPLDEYFSGTLKGSKAFPAGGARIVPIGPPPKLVNPEKLQKAAKPNRRYPVRKAA